MQQGDSDSQPGANLFLSLISGIQAPVIMMSQNRQEERDRLRAEQDYEVNLKAEIEIGRLHAKVDELREKDWSHLLDIQRQQLQLLLQQAELLSIRRVDQPPPER